MVPAPNPITISPDFSVGNNFFATSLMSPEYFRKEPQFSFNSFVKAREFTPSIGSSDAA